MKYPRRYIRTGGTAALLIALLAGALTTRTPAQEPEAETPPPAPKVERATVIPPARPAEAPPAEAPPAEAPPAEAREVEARPAEAREAEAPPGHHAVREVRLLKDGGGRVEGARQEDWIAFDLRGADERYDVWAMRVETGVEDCITCDHYAFRKVSALNPAWHPSGDYLVVQVQTSPKRRGLDAAALATPLRAMGSELWVVARDGRDYWQITHFGERGGAVLDPHFSHEAGLLAWSERLTSREPPWGEWVVRVAELRIKRRMPHLGKTRTYGSGMGRGLVVAHDFTPDDRGLLVSGIPDRGLGAPDVLRLDLETQAVERLTSSPDESDELASSVPYSDYLVWVTDRGLVDPRHGGPAPSRPLARRTEVWLRSASGMAQERLTYFNDPRSEHYLGAALIGDLSWTADGESLLLHVVSVPEGSTEAREGIYLVKLGTEYRR